MRHVVFMSLVGIFLVPQLLIWRLTGRLTVRGFDRLKSELQEGGLIIAANHLTILDAWLITFLIFPHNLQSRLHAWNVPDCRIFARPFRWLFPALRCMPIRRGEGSVRSNILVFQRIIRRLKLKDSVLVFCEEGRTFGENNEKFALVRKNDRIIRKLRSDAAIKMARASDARILPLYIQASDLQEPVSFCRTLFQMWGGSRMELYIGHIIPNSRVQTLTLSKLEEAILSAY